MQREFVKEAGTYFYVFNDVESILDAMVMWASLDHVNRHVEMRLDADAKQFIITDRKKGGAK